MWSSSLIPPGSQDSVAKMGDANIVQRIPSRRIRTSSRRWSPIVATMKGRFELIFCKYETHPRREYTTSPFTILEPRNSWIDEFYVVQERRETDFEVSKLLKSSSGNHAFLTELLTGGRREGRSLSIGAAMHKKNEKSCIASQMPD